MVWSLPPVTALASAVQEGVLCTQNCVNCLSWRHVSPLAGTQLQAFPSPTVKFLLRKLFNFLEVIVGSTLITKGSDISYLQNFLFPANIHPGWLQRTWLGSGAELLDCGSRWSLRVFVLGAI